MGGGLFEVKKNFRSLFLSSAILKKTVFFKLARSQADCFFNETFARKGGAQKKMTTHQDWFF